VELCWEDHAGGGVCVGLLGSALAVVLLLLPGPSKPGAAAPAAAATGAACFDLGMLHHLGIPDHASAAIARGVLSSNSTGWKWVLLRNAAEIHYRLRLRADSWSTQVCDRPSIMV
jgi:hypothetical protein